MAIRIIKHDDIHITATELARYRYEFQREFAMYSGPRPDFEEWVRNRIRQERLRGRDSGTKEGK